MKSPHPPSMTKITISAWTAQALERAGYNLNEVDLIKCIDENKSKMLVYHAVLALRNLGTSKSLSTLKRTVNYPMDDVKVCSVLAIGAIAREAETEYYASLLASPSFRHKVYAMAVIWEVGDDRAHQSVIALAKKALGHKIKLHTYCDALYIAEYLDRFKDETSKTLSANLKQLDIPYPSLR